MTDLGQSRQEAKTARIKYIFTDIEAFTHGRTVEAMTDILDSFNKIVSKALEATLPPNANIIKIPTGDGMCIALIEVHEPYDIHISLARQILQELESYNNQNKDQMRNYKVRIGINENIDNVVSDINQRENLAGDGINTAQRVMSFADGNQILIGQTVYDILKRREKYQGKFKEFSTKDKHGTPIKVYQYLPNEGPKINENYPTSLVAVPLKERKLSKKAAYYFANAIRHEEFLRKNAGKGQSSYAAIVLLWFLADDCVEKNEPRSIDNPFEPKTENLGKTLQEQFDSLVKLPFWVCCDFEELVGNDLFSGLNSSNFVRFDHRLISPIGKEKLKNEWPSIYQEFGF